MSTTPYYQDERVTIYHGDCREIVPELARSHRFDLCIADPPYAETSLEWDRWPAGWPQVLLGPARSMFCFGTLRMFMDRAAEFKGWRMSQDGVWEKHNGSNAAKDRFRRLHENWAHFYDAETPWSEIHKEPQFTFDAVKRRISRRTKPQHWGGIGASKFASEDGGARMMGSVIFARSCNGYAENETQKPEGLLRPLIEYGCPKGGVLLDCFTGSGTALRVAKDTGRRAVGIDSREAQCEVAAKRMAQEALALL